MQKEFGAFLNVFSGASGGFLEMFSCLKLGPHMWVKGIVQPFELGGETRLIRSAVKY